ncbi:MAG: T9SS type A sorting domain-containing protein, partial [Ignavibacteria bacterium]
ELPAEYSLSQNYPNPFNPSTKIKFSIPNTPLSFGEGQGVGLFIYNSLGQQITTLINQQLTPGTYEVEWDASNFPSGLYFYQLTSGEYSETKKMILLK